MSIVGQVGEIRRYPVKSMGGERLDSCEFGARDLLGDRGWALREEQVGEIRGGTQISKLMLCTARYVEETSDETITHAEIQLPDGTMTRTDSSTANEILSKFLGRPVTLWPVQPASKTEHYRRSQRTDEASFRKLLSRRPDEPLPDSTSFPQSLVEELCEYVSPLGTCFDVAPLHLLTTASVAALSSLLPGAVIDARRFRPNLDIDTNDGTQGFVEFDRCGKLIGIGEISITCGQPVPRCGMTTHEQPGLQKDSSILRTIVRQVSRNMGSYGSESTRGNVKIED